MATKVLNSKRKAPDPGQKKGDFARQTILHEAIRLFSRHGYNDTTFQMIADRCGISQPIIVYYFKTKAGLFEVAVTHCQEQSQKIISGTYAISDDAYQRLRKICLGTINWTNMYRSQAQLHLLLAYFASTQEAFVKLYQDYVSKVRFEIEGVVMAGKREGTFNYTLEPGLLAENIQELILGLCINLLAGRTLSKMRDLEKKIDQALQDMVKYKR